MILRLFGPSSQAGALKRNLDASSMQLREIAHRVANATTPGGGSFAAVLNEELAAQTIARLEEDMVNLADTQLRFEASIRLLQRTYQQLRTSIRERL